MKNVLFLAHRIPFPPNKGDKIRSFHVLRYLSERANIYLGCFIDDPMDQQYQSKVASFCRDSHIQALNHTVALVRSLTGFINGKALSFPYYYSKEMDQWVTRTLSTQKIDCVFVFSSSMAQYIPIESFRGSKVLDFVDVDSQKWLDYASNKRFPVSQVYKREGRKLRTAEREFADTFDTSLFVSVEEVECFKEQVHCSPRSEVLALPNGVDTTFFDPELDFEHPYEESSNIVFTGAMDYWANVDAMTWFAHVVYPLIETPNVNLAIVGANPSKQVQNLDALEGITVYGRVDDVRPFIAASSAVVAPLRIARGIQNKVLEALAMERPVVMTSGAAEGIDVSQLRESIAVDSAKGMARAIDKVLEQGVVRAVSGREYIMRYHDWASCLDVLDEKLGLAADE
ncbi:MAG: TIGR03087 family PEP-CTERM/XrtA system glycosyltransferase [Pseudomonadota bacterium]